MDLAAFLLFVAAIGCATLGTGTAIYAGVLSLVISGASVLGAKYEENRGVDAPVNARESEGIWAEGFGVFLLEVAGQLGAMGGWLALVPAGVALYNDISAILEDANKLTAKKKQSRIWV